jgi:hypothetical protein
MIKSRNTIILIVAIFVLVGVAGYMLFFKESSDSSVIPVDGPASSAEFTFITLASQIGTITFDTSILSDSRFTMLQDIRTAVIPESAGKRDPFAPIPGLVVPATR